MGVLSAPPEPGELNFSGKFKSWITSIQSVMNNFDITSADVATTSQNVTECVAYATAAEASAADAASSATTAAGVVVQQNDNLLINADFVMNQESGHSGSTYTLANTGDYGHDMWSAYGATTYTFSSDGTVNVSAGNILQKNDYFLSLDGESVTFSVQSGSVNLRAPGRGNVIVTPSSPVTWSWDDSDFDNSLALAGNTDFRGPKLELGTVATGYNKQDPTVNELQCKRYFWKPPGNVLYLPINNINGTNCYTPHFLLPANLSSIPSVTWDSATIYLAGSGGTLASSETPETIIFSIALTSGGTAGDSGLVTLTGLEVDSRY